MSTGGSGPSQALLGNAAIAAAIKSGNVNIAGQMKVEEMDLSSESKEAQMQHAETLRRFEAQQRSRAILVPTLIDDVKKKLRELGHEVTLFGEGPGDRRERLKTVIAEMELSEEDARDMQRFMASSRPGAGSSELAMPGGYTEQKPATSSTSTSSSKEVFYTHAPDALVAARKYLCEYSFPRAHDRLLRTKRVRESEQMQVEEDKLVGEKYLHLKGLSLAASQFVDDRPLCSVRYSPDDSMIAVGSWTGVVKMWDSTSLDNVGMFTGHEERVTSVAWQPVASGSGGLLASSAADGTCMLWHPSRGHSASNAVRGTAMETDEADGGASSGDKDVIAREVSDRGRAGVLRGHEGVVSRCAFHPSGTYIGTAGHDYTWRLWDVETCTELLMQDGHAKECNAIAFHHDGALTLTGDTGGVALLWDIRSGQCIQVFQGHIKKIVSASFNVNGFMVATGSTDNTAKVWDLRTKKVGYTLPAHSSIISDTRFSSSGEILTTSSFDGTLKMWNTRNFDIIKTLSGHEGKVMSCDMSSDETSLISAGYDRTIKLWKKDD